MRRRTNKSDLPDDDAVIVVDANDYFLYTDDDCRAIDDILHLDHPTMIGKPRMDLRFLMYVTVEETYGVFYNVETEEIRVRANSLADAYTKAHWIRLGEIEDAR